MIQEKTYMELAEEYTDSWFEECDCLPERTLLDAIEDQAESWVDYQGGIL